MLISRLHRFIALLLLLAFTSQTMATAAMNCERSKLASNTESPAMNNMDMSAMNLADSAMLHMHHMDTPNHSHNNHQAFDCCKTMGHCLMGGCSIAITHYSISFLLRNIHSMIEIFYLDILPSPLISSRYRPPIFC